MKLEVNHTWHVRFDADAVLYDVSWSKIGKQLRLSGFAVNPLPGTPYGLSVSHSHAGAITLFTLQHPRLVQYVDIVESPCVGS